MATFYTRIVLPIGLVAGTIIGAGVFALPYIFTQSGLFTGIFYIALGAAIYLFIHLTYADIVIRTAGDHRFVGYAKMYLGAFAGKIATLMTIVGMIFTQTAYLVLSISFTRLIFPHIPSTTAALIFWGLGSLAIFLNVRKLALSEALMTFTIIVITGVLFMLGGASFLEKGITLQLPTNSALFLLPLAPVLFAFSGRVAIPTLISYFKASRHKNDYLHMRRAIAWGTCIPAIVYMLFVVGVWGLSVGVTEDAVTGLASTLPATLLLFIGILGFLSIFSSYMTIGVDTVASLAYDLKVSRLLRASIVVVGPLMLYAIGFTSFLGLVGFVGGIFLALEGIFILLIWRRARHVGTARLISPIHPLALLSGFILFGLALLYQLGAYIVW